MSGRFPLPTPPACPVCGQPAVFAIVKPSRPNADRPYYYCQRSHSWEFVTWDDDIGIDPGNPLCDCGLTSRRNIGTRPGVTPWYACETKTCRFKEDIEEDVEADSTAGRAELRGSSLPSSPLSYTPSPAPETPRSQTTPGSNRSTPPRSTPDPPLNSRERTSARDSNVDSLTNGMNTLLISIPGTTPDLKTSTISVLVNIPGATRVSFATKMECRKRLRCRIYCRCGAGS